MKHVDAGSAAAMLQSLFKPTELTVVADQRVGDLVVRGDARVLDEVEVLLLRLDESGASNKAQPSAAAQKPTVPNRADTLASLEELYQALKSGQADAQASAGTSSSVDSLRDQLRQAEAQAQKIAKLLRSRADSKQNYEAEKNELRQWVTQAFRLRQSLQRAEVHQFLTRLLEISQTIELREGIASEIIERRVRELLDAESAGSAERSTNRAAAVFEKRQPEAATDKTQTLATPAAAEMQSPRFSVQVDYVRSANSIQWLNRSGAAQTSNQGTTFSFPAGMQSEFRISGFPANPALRAFVSVDVAILSDRNAEIVSLNSAELRLRGKDFEKLTAGELVTRIFWIPYDLSEVGENLIMVSDDASGIANRGTIVATWKMSADAKKVLTDAELPRRP
ncbi:MAG: secretin N-terminal domain-containing protein [Aureliella sp.]